MNKPDNTRRHMQDDWSLPGGVTYLNHGSFGPSPKLVQAARQTWIDRLESEPMDFFVRQMEAGLDEACRRLGTFVGADADNLIFVDNATVAMNIVAANIDLAEGDEVLFTDQEYGAVLRIWRQKCQSVGAQTVVRRLPTAIQDDNFSDEIVEALKTGMTERTRLIVVSHVTSPTATILPVKKICQLARERGIPICIDGPHAVAMSPLEIEKLGCDFYAASCHKWLSAPFGSGFLYVSRKRQQGLKPAITSWGGSVNGRPASWKDEFTWIGTRDPSAYLAVPAAIDFLENYGIEKFRNETHELTRYARQQIAELTGQEALVPDSQEWYGSMISMPIAGDPPKSNQHDPLQSTLWEKHRIEIPIFGWQGKRLLRVSSHLYNSKDDVDLLVEALRMLLK